MTKKTWYLVSLISTLVGGSVVAAQGGRPERFAQMDKNGDGVVTTAEFEAGLLARWTESDANKDGKVSEEELKAGFGVHRKERFDQRDSNKNGVLERSEVQRMPEPMFARIDADKSGTLSKAEFENMRPPHKGQCGMRKLPGDANGDGVVTKAEAVAGAAEFAKRLDDNGDGKLTGDEFGRRGGGHRGHHRGPHHELSDEE